ncbi:MAG: hypothetical protein LBD20_02555 [Spirochaetaceae bacterium]|jgi:DNA-binding transcriptional regulator YiaG|nr:hypothetical protein [Spirochaetaceae bacterium]
MTDIELTKKLDSLEWEADLDHNRINSALVSYKIIQGNTIPTDKPAMLGTYLSGPGENVLLIAEWISDDVKKIKSTMILNQINRGATAAYREAVFCKKNSLPTRAELNSWKQRHNLTGARIALLCGVECRTVRHWLSGARIITTSCWRLLRVLLGDITPAEQLAEIEAEKSTKIRKNKLYKDNFKN